MCQGAGIYLVRQVLGGTDLGGNQETPGFVGAKAQGWSGWAALGAWVSLWPRPKFPPSPGCGLLAWEIMGRETQDF